MQPNAHIPEELYRQIHAHMPIPCVDIVIIHDGRVLLHKRSNKPAQGQWWFPGGRVLKGETLANAARRKMLEEVGLMPQTLEYIGGDETLFDDGPFDGPTHTINSVFRATVENIDHITLDTQASEWKWFTEADKEWHPYVKAFHSKGLCK